MTVTLSNSTRPGNHYIMKGTWVRDRTARCRDLGVVSSIRDDADRVTILWHPNSIEHISAFFLRAKLREGTYQIDREQHPYP